MAYNSSQSVGYNNAFVAAESHRNYYLSATCSRVISFSSSHRPSCGRSPTAFGRARSSLDRERIANRVGLSNTAGYHPLSSLKSLLVTQISRVSFSFPAFSIFVSQLRRIQAAAKFLAILLGQDRRKKGGKWAREEVDERVSLSCNFPAKRYVLCTMDFECGNFRRSRFAHGKSPQRAQHARHVPLSCRTAVTPCTPGVGWLIAGAASLYGVSTLEWKLVAAVCMCC